jgi:flagellar basal-body rod protein FlgB
MDELSSDLRLLSRLMDATAQRTRVIAHNLANVNTPGFTRSEVSFEGQLAEALNRGGREAALEVKPEVVTDTGGEVKLDGNNVHMEDEMAELMKTTIMYNIINRIVSGKIEGLRTAIHGR